ncbi:MAG: hypothetical protein ACT4OP_03720, partial [Actinomycetota bacterium]
MRTIWIACGLVMLIAVPVGALAASELIDQLELSHFYVEEGVDATIGEMELLVDRHPAVYFVALAGETSGGADQLAADLLDLLGSGTVVVLTPAEVGAVSFEYGESDLDRAFDAVSATEASSYVTDFAEFAGALTGTSPSSPAQSNDGFPVVPVLVGSGVVGLIGLGLWYSRRRQKQAMSSRLDEARVEIRQQMDVVAGQIVNLADDARTEANPEATAHYRQASQTFQAAETRLAEATTLSQLEALSDDLDRARWELEATAALIEGRP